MTQLLYRIARKTLRTVLPETKHVALNHWFDLKMGGENELRFLHKMGPNKGTAIDIGANEGLFSYALSKLYDSVIAFEINPDLSSKLKRADIPKLKVIEKGLSSSPGYLTLYIPVQNGQEQTGWASVIPGNLPGATEHVEKKVEVITLDSLQLPAVSFIKLDVEGHELAVLEGAAQTLRQHHPILMIEIREEHRPAIFSFLGELGYSRTSLKELCGVQGAEYNFIFVPTAQAR